MITQLPFDFNSRSATVLRDAALDRGTAANREWMDWIIPRLVALAVYRERDGGLPRVTTDDVRMLTHDRHMQGGSTPSDNRAFGALLARLCRGETPLFQKVGMVNSAVATSHHRPVCEFELVEGE